MYAATEPLVSVSIIAQSLAHIQNELTSFGLNPYDWRPARPSKFTKSHLVLVHREDESLRLAVNVRQHENRAFQPEIVDIEMMLE